METLVPLIQSLKPKEKQRIKDFYQLGSSRSSQTTKRLLLFELILAKKVRNDQDAYQALYAHCTRSALCQLKKRLQQDIMNVILLSSSSGARPSTINQEMHCHKSFIMSQMLIERGLLKEGLCLLEKTSSQARKCELISIQLSCDDALRSLQTGPHQEYDEKINRSLNDFKDLLQAKEFYFTTTQTTVATTVPVLRDDRLKLLEKKADDCHSRKATFWYTMALICYHKHKGNLSSAKLSALDLLKDATHCLPMMDEREKAAFYLQYAQILVALREPQKAIQPAQQSVQFARNTSSQLLIALQVLFQAHFQVCHWQQAEKVWQQANQARFQDNTTTAGVWFFLKSCLLFVQKKHKESTQYLLAHENMINYKSDLILWAKLLELINILEVEDFDWFEFKLESYRKRLRRFGCQHSERMRLLLHLFNSLKGNNFNYRVTQLHENTTLALLNDNSPDMGWNPLSFELINIHDWFTAKVTQPLGGKVKSTKILDQR